MLLLAACAPLPTRPSAGPLADIRDDVAAVSATALSSTFSIRSVRVDVADRAWRVIAGHFYDPNLNGVDWSAVRKITRTRAGAATSDAEFYAALKDMAASLGDSHTMVLTPRETLDRRRFVSTRTGMQITFVDGRVAISEVEPDSPAARVGISVGDVLLGVGGMRFDAPFVRAALADPRLEHSDVIAGDGPEALPADAVDNERVRVLRAVRREMRRAATARGQAGGVMVDVVRADGTLLHTLLKPAPSPRPPSAHLRWLDGDIAVLRFSRFVPELRADIDAALDEAARARALIVDLRGNGGGLIEMFRWFTGRFLSEEHLAMRSLTRDRVDGENQNITDMYVGPSRFENRPRPLLQPLAVLIDGRTGSAAELAAVVLEEQRSAILVGEPTCGCVVGVRYEYVLPDGGGLRVAETGFVSAHGARLEGVPTLPAVRVMPTLVDLRSGRDVVLDEAARQLAKVIAR